MKRVLLAMLVTAPLFALFMTPVGATTPPPVGRIWSAVENVFTHRLAVSGYAYDPSAPGTAIRVRIFVDGRNAGTVVANEPSPDLDRAHHLSGGHRFSMHVSWSYSARTAVLKSRGAHTSNPLMTLASSSITHYEPPAGTRIVTIAKRYVGARYVEGGASPAGFDCSGYTMYVYEQAHVHTLPHNAERQRELMRPIARTSARPGDLVFYMSGGTAYHVAIYAGRGWQYAAATPADGVRYQPVWSSAVQYRTDWH